MLKVAWKRPEEAIEWSPAEREIVCGGPFSRRELLTYRLTLVMRVTLFKSVITSLLLFSDLRVWSAGFLGIVLALGLLELWRMVLEIATYSISRRAYHCLSSRCLWCCRRKCCVCVHNRCQRS